MKGLLLGDKKKKKNPTENVGKKHYLCCIAQYYHVFNVVIQVSNKILFFLLVNHSITHAIKT